MSAGRSSPTWPEKTCRWPGCPRDTPTRWPSWPSSAPARRRPGAAGASGPAQPPGPGLTATRAAGGWRLDGIKRYCSGARSCTHALVTAAAPDGNRLFAVGTRELAPVEGTWPATGMAGSDTLDVEFTDIPGEPVGEPGSYTGRPGFAHGGAGVAACWYGGARAVGQTLLAAAAKRDVPVARTPWPTWAPSTSPCTPPGTRSSGRPRRSTPTRRTASTPAGGGPCGCARSSRPRRPRSWRGWAGRSGRPAVPRRGARAPGRRPDRLPAAASRRTGPGRSRRAGGRGRRLVVGPSWW